MARSPPTMPPMRGPLLSPPLSDEGVPAGSVEDWAGPEMVLVLSAWALMVLDVKVGMWVLVFRSAVVVLADLVVVARVVEGAVVVDPNPYFIRTETWKPGTEALCHAE